MKKILAVTSLIFSMVFMSCDQDFNTIGADLVGDEHFDFDKHEADVKASSFATGEVQTNNLTINPLGFYKNPYFGETKANFVSQIAMNLAQPKFGTSVQIENVKLYIPFFSHITATDSDGANTYVLDSIFGADPESKMKLNVFENGYYLNSFDANDQTQSAKYYSDMDGLIDAQKRGTDASGNSVPVTSGGTRLNDSTDPSQNDQFFFNKNEIIVYKTKFNTGLGQIQYVDANDVPLADQNDVSLRVIKERLAPGIYLDLNKEFFKKKVLDASSANLFNNNAFKQYFKGLYFQVEHVAGQDGAMAMLNFSNAKINLNYSSVSEGAVAGSAATSKTMLLTVGVNGGSNTVSLQDFSYGGVFATGLANPANTFGDPSYGQNERLYLKGGKGSVVYLDLFGDDKEFGPDGDSDNDDGILDNASDPSYHNGIPDELDWLRKQGYLINDAYLEFYVDKTAMAGTTQEEAQRIYLFDATNQRPLIDYIFDSSTSTNPKNNKLLYGGIIQRDNTGKGEKYKIRITQHISNVLNSTNDNLNKNVKLGLSVTDMITVSTNFYYKNPLTFGAGTDDDIKYFPVSSIMSQQGTVLHGPASTDAAKRLKLVIYYTKPN